MIASLPLFAYVIMLMFLDLQQARANRETDIQMANPGMSEVCVMTVSAGNENST